METCPKIKTILYLLYTARKKEWNFSPILHLQDKRSSCQRSGHCIPWKHFPMHGQHKHTQTTMSLPRWSSCCLQLCLLWLLLFLTCRLSSGLTPVRLKLIVDFENILAGICSCWSFPRIYRKAHISSAMFAFDLWSSRSEGSCILVELWRLSRGEIEGR